MLVEFYDYKCMPKGLSASLNKVFYSTLAVEKSRLLYDRAFALKLIKQHDLQGKTAIELKENALLQRHCELLCKQTKMWTFGSISNCVRLFTTKVPGMQLDVTGIVFFNNVSLSGRLSDILCTFDDSIGAAALLNDLENQLKPIMVKLEDMVHILLTTKQTIDIIINDDKIERYASSCFNNVAEFNSSFSIFFTKGTKLVNKLPYIHKLCEYISMHVLSVHEQGAMRFMPSIDKMIQNCTENSYLPNSKYALKRSHIMYGKSIITELFGALIMPQIQKYLESFQSIEQLLQTFEVDSLDALERYMIVYQDALMSLNVVDIKFGDFIPELASTLQNVYIEKDRMELFNKTSLLFSTPPSAYRITEQDRLYMKKAFPLKNSSAEFRTFTKATVEAYSDYKSTINDDIYELPSIIISGQAKTVISICHELLKQFSIDPVNNVHIVFHCKSLLDNLRHLLYNESHITSLSSACIAYNDNYIYCPHHIVIFNKLIKDKLEVMDSEFQVCFYDLFDLFQQKGKLLMITHIDSALRYKEDDFKYQLQCIWYTLKEHLSDESLKFFKSIINDTLDHLNLSNNDSAIKKQILQ